MGTKSFLIFLTLSACLVLDVRGQSSSSQFWFFLTHTQELNRKFEVLLDAQTRSVENLKQLNTLLVRTAFAYRISENTSLAVGFAYKADYEAQRRTSQENRVYEQYQRDLTVGKIEIQGRGRFEQRWINDSERYFLLRLRGFISARIPLVSNPDFSRGLYAGLQNEIFLNLPNNRRKITFFDQNRPFASFGYRFSKKIDASLDAGLLTEREEMKTENFPVMRFSITTTF